MIRYKNTQIGYITIISLLVAIIIIFFSINFKEKQPVIFIVLGILIFVLFLFSTLTITITEKYLKINYGIGLIRKKILLNKISSIKQVKNKWYYGWGIRYTPHGWLYNISGFDAIEIQLKNNKTIRIGTNEPIKLFNYLNNSINN